MPQPIVVFPQEVVAGNAPVGSGEHIVQDGECISFLASKHRVPARDIFDHPNNADLKRIRNNLNVLFPRDRVAIRPIEIKEDPASTDAKHLFELSGEPVFLQIQILDRDKPVANQPFTLRVRELTIVDVTGADGTIKVQIPPTAATGFLQVGPPDNLLQMNLVLGALHPAETNSGVQQRLQNLGFDCGPLDGIVGPRTRAAVTAFQTKFGLPADGIVGIQTRNLLKQKHGC